MSRKQIRSYDTEVEYLAHRQEYIGGADAAAILGLSPYPDDTRLQTWKAKTVPPSEIDQLDNCHIHRGNFMEGVAEKMVTGDALWLDEEDAINVRAEPGAHHRHEKFDYIGGTPDLVAPTRIYEVKAPNTGRVEDIKKNGLPDHYWIQGEHYRLLMDKPITFLIVDYNGWDLYRIDVPEPKGDLQGRMLEKYHEFWQMVEEGTPPTQNDLPDVNIRAADAGEKLETMLADYHDAHEESKRLDRKRKDIKGRILTHTQGVDALDTENYRMTRHEQSRGDSSWTVLKVNSKRA